MDSGIVKNQAERIARIRRRASEQAGGENGQYIMWLERRLDELAFAVGHESGARATELAALVYEAPIDPTTLEPREWALHVVTEWTRDGCGSGQLVDLIERTIEQARDRKRVDADRVIVKLEQALEPFARFGRFCQDWPAADNRIATLVATARTAITYADLDRAVAALDRPVAALDRPVVWVGDPEIGVDVGVERCPAHRSFNRCERDLGHDGKHKTDGLEWD